MLPDPRLGKAERLRQHHLLDILVKALRTILRRRMQRHHEHPELHRGSI